MSDPLARFTLLLKSANGASLILARLTAINNKDFWNILFLGGPKLPSQS
jgi:hypothetical protein